MPTFLRHPLAKEISLAIAIKLLVIAAIFMRSSTAMRCTPTPMP
ncbi:hypothetical protein [Thiobacillus sp.]|nr:hypothetical protein [Thiobacillus sp.]